jgi:Nucleotidyl transferase AbiEii toxin, Type IV TA system
MNLHYDILDAKRKEILPLFQTVTDWGYYLAGGTALALILGHRDSIDFDFFIPEPIDTALLYKKCEELFSEHKLLRTQEEPNTLGLLIDNEIRLSFMTYNYPLVTPLTATEYFSLASLTDIGCMKISAITSRNVYKDYVDLYFMASVWVGLTPSPSGEDFSTMCTYGYCVS